jgi:HD-GYP domain-containing protein (c-di-GMP phosphodiesterase class II)
MLVDHAKGELTMQARQGALPAAGGEARQRVGDGIAGWVAQTGEPLLVQGDALPPELRNLSASDQVTSAVSVPLKASGRTLGVITVSSLSRRRFADTDVHLLSRLAADAGMALENANLYGEVQRGFLETVAALAEAVDAKDPYTRGHSERVTGLAIAVAKELGVAGGDLEALSSAAVLHDIGKIGVAEQILSKPGPLSDTEWEAMRAHPDLGAAIVGPVSALRQVVPLLKHHHERWDGTGYPAKLKGEEIPLGSRILALADAYEAMTSDRAYRKAMPPERAVEILKEGAGRQWDPGVVIAFLKVREAGQA